MPVLSRASVLGRVLVALGGLVVTLGALFPEARVAAARLLDPGTPHPSPDRSHWVVIQEDVDMLSDPDESLDDWNYDFYRGEAAGLSYLVVVGVVLAASAAFAQSRVAATAFGVVHAAMWLLLAWLAFTVWRVVPQGSGGTQGLKRWGLWGAIAVALCAAGEALVVVRAVRRAASRRVLAVDAAALLPAAFLLLVGAALWAAFRTHPNWPGGGYGVMAVGALLVLLGIATRRAPRSSVGAACPPDVAVLRSPPRPDGAR
jgi:hypothetical protein